MAWAVSEHLQLPAGIIQVGGAGSSRHFKFGVLGAKGTGTISNDTSVTVTGNVEVGQKVDSIGSLALSDAILLSIGKSFNIGNEGGEGTVTISGGTITTGGTMDVGAKLGSVGTFNMSGGSLSVGTLEVNKAMRIGYKGGKGTGTISGENTAINVSGNFVIGNNVDGEVGGDGMLTILDGIINVGGGDFTHELSVGKNRGTGLVNMSGGRINVLNGDARIGETTYTIIEEPYEEIPHYGFGTMIMTGGILSISDSNSLQIGLDGSEGLLELIDGEIYAGDLEIGVPGSGGTLDIHNGLLVLVGDKRDLVQNYFDNEMILAFDGSDIASLEIVFDEIQGKTFVTAIPEPATIALLGLGVLALRRRKRK